VAQRFQRCDNRFVLNGGFGRREVLQNRRSVYSSTSKRRRSTCQALGRRGHEKGLNPRAGSMNAIAILQQSRLISSLAELVL
jgi:hypothetical protein